MVPGRAVSFGRREGLDLGCPGDPGRPKPGSEPQLGAGNRNSNPGRALARRRRRGNAAPKRDSDKGSGAHAADGGSGAALWAAGNRARPDWRRSRPGTHGRDLLDQEVLPPGPAAVFPSSPCSPSIRDRDRDAPLLCAPGASSFLTVSRLPGSFWRTPTLTFLLSLVPHPRDTPSTTSAPARSQPRSRGWRGGVATPQWAWGRILRVGGGGAFLFHPSDLLSFPFFYQPGPQRSPGPTGCSPGWGCVPWVEVHPFPPRQSTLWMPVTARGGRPGAHSESRRTAVPSQLEARGSEALASLTAAIGTRWAGPPSRRKRICSSQVATGSRGRNLSGHKV